MQSVDFVRLLRSSPVVVLLSVVSAVTAAASPITYRFAGQVTWQPNAVLDSAVALGDRFEGLFLVDPNATIAVEPGSSLALLDSPWQWIGIRFDSGYSVDGRTQVVISHDSSGSVYGAVTPTFFPWTPVGGAPVAGFRPVHVGVWFVSSGVPLGTGHSPVPANLHEYTLRSMTLDFGRATGPGGMLFYPVSGEIEDVAPMPGLVTPEPATWLLMATGLGGLLRRGWRRRSRSV